MKLILLHGENNYNSELKLQEYISTLSKTFSKIVKVDGETAKTINDLKLDFDISLFGEKKALVIKRIFQNQSKVLLEAFLKYIESQLKDTSDSTIVIWEDKKADKRTILYKYILKNFKEEEFPKLSYGELNSWVIKYGLDKGLKIGSNEAYLITLRVGENIKVIANEIDKLASLKLDKISEKDIAKYLSESSEHNIFELLEIILDLLEISNSKDKNTEFHTKYSKMQKLAERLFEDYKNYPSLIANLTSNISTLLRIKILEEDGLNQADISSQIPMHPFVFRKLYGRSSSFNRKFLEDKFELLSDLDYKFKKGDIDAIGVVIMMVK